MNILVPIPYAKVLRLGSLAAAFSLLTISTSAISQGEQPTPGIDAATAGASSSPPTVRFTNITATAGIEFAHEKGAYGAKLLPETMGGGVAFFDYDNDGDQDLLFVNSNFWPGHEPEGAPPPTSALYRNDGTGNFEDVSAAARLDLTLYGMGVATGDYDNDGWVDLYITAVGENRLLRNDKGIFRDVTAQAGVAGAAEDWSTGAAFVDVDNDGDLDLFGVNYLEWSVEADLLYAKHHDYIRMGDNRAYAMPQGFGGTYSFLYRNDGGGRFADVAADSGIQVDHPATGRPMAKGLAVAPVDLDADGWIDLMVANDKQTNFCFHNQGDGTFAEKALEIGVGFDANGVVTAAMGIDAAHYRNDSSLGIAIGNYAAEFDSLFVSRDTPSPLPTYPCEKASVPLRDCPLHSDSFSSTMTWTVGSISSKPTDISKRISPPRHPVRLTPSRLSFSGTAAGPAERPLSR